MGDELYMYYGAADTRIALATTKIQTLLDALHEEGSSDPIVVAPHSAKA